MNLSTDTASNCDQVTASGWFGKFVVVEYLFLTKKEMVGWKEGWWGGGRGREGDEEGGGEEGKGRGKVRWRGRGGGREGMTLAVVGD